MSIFNRITQFAVTLSSQVRCASSGVLLGRYTSGAGQAQEITLGDLLKLSGSVLDVTGLATPIMTFSPSAPVNGVGKSLTADMVGTAAGGSVTFRVDSDFLETPLIIVINTNPGGMTGTQLLTAVRDTFATNPAARSSGITMGGSGTNLLVYSPLHDYGPTVTDESFALTITSADSGFSSTTGAEHLPGVVGTEGILGQSYILDDGIQQPFVWICTRELPPRWTNIKGGTYSSPY